MDIDECLTDNGGCDSNALCTNTPGSFTCTCQNGLVGSGTYCSDAFAQIAVTQGATCGVRTDGSLWCWGATAPSRSNAGYLTPGVWSATPQRVDEANDWASVSINEMTSCGLKTDGSMWCWGYDVEGYSNGVTSSLVSSPVEVESSSTWTSVCAGFEDTCAVKSDGTLWCMGDSSDGALGIPGDELGATFAQVSPGSTWASVSCGGWSACAISNTDGSLWCWGQSQAMDSILGSFYTGDLPVLVEPGKKWIAAAADFDEICAVEADGVVFCGGLENTYSFPTGLVAVTAAGFTGVSVDQNVACGVSGAGAIECWGMNHLGQMGNGNQTSTQDAVAGGVGHEWTSVAVASDHTCALATDGTAWCWGANGAGQLGTGQAGSQLAPGAFGNGQAVSGFWVGSGDICVLGTDGSLDCAGAPTRYMIGTESLAVQTPTSVSVTSVVDVAFGVSAACAVRADGSLWCWATPGGFDRFGAPGPFDAGTTWMSVAGDAYLHCGLQADGSLWCWSDETIVASNGPVAVTLSVPWTTLSMGNGNICGIDTNGALWCGPMQYGITAVTVSALAQLPGGPWTQASVGVDGVCALATDGTAWCGTSSLTKLSQVDGNQWTSVAAGDGGSCGTHADGSLWCWQNGATSPTLLDDTAQWLSVKAAGSGWDFCGQKADDTVWCWGDDTWGELGNDAAWVLTPTLVSPF